MSKNHRGAGIRTLPSHGRATCPICKIENIKCLYEKEIDGQTVKICKKCNAALKNKARREPPVVETPAEAAPEAPAEETPATE